MRLSGRIRLRELKEVYHPPKADSSYGWSFQPLRSSSPLWLAVTRDSVCVGSGRTEMFP